MPWLAWLFLDLEVLGGLVIRNTYSIGLLLLVKNAPQIWKLGKMSALYTSIAARVSFGTKRMMCFVQ